MESSSKALNLLQSARLLMSQEFGFAISPFQAIQIAQLIDDGHNIVRCMEEIGMSSSEIQSLKNSQKGELPRHEIQNNAKFTEKVAEDRGRAFRIFDAVFIMLREASQNEVFHFDKYTLAYYFSLADSLDSGRTMEESIEEAARLAKCLQQKDEAKREANKSE